MPEYVKRIRMRRPMVAWMPRSDATGIDFQPWDRGLIDTHASVKFLSFVGTIDARIFRNLSNLTGCRLLMTNVADDEHFCAAATWLLMCEGSAVGTVQGLLCERRGSIQNIGILPAYRRRGFGAALIAKSLEGFRAAGAREVCLEVTAGNPSAMRLYRRLGFRPYNTYFREVSRTDPCPT